MQAYIYNTNTKVIVATISGDDQTAIESEASIYDGDEYAVTYTPGFGSVDGLLDTGEHEEIKI
ncbi:hypothetical protein [Methylomonas sp. AM2-LC]|uniref:hypothetical protein n=1 Tax=Methylomonas sp. AM2-LC TaxID=3153301 RepID=UPI003267C4A2